MKLIASLLFVVPAMAAMSTVSRAGLAPRPLTGELIHTSCFIEANGSVGDEYKSCIADHERKAKSVTFALLTSEGDVYVLVSQKGQTLEDFRLGEQVQVNGMRTIMVGSMKRMK